MMNEQTHQVANARGWERAPPHLTIGNTLINKDIHSPQSNISSLGELLITVSDKYRMLKKCLGTN